MFRYGFCGAQSLARWGACLRVAVYLEFRSRLTQSIARKHGEIAAAVSREAGLLVQTWGLRATRAEMPREEVDRQLKAKSSTRAQRRHDGGNLGDDLED